MTAGHMQWMLSDDSSRMTLYVRENDISSWMLYSRTPYRVPDLTIPGASKGWTTYQKLRTQGWELLASET